MHIIREQNLCTSNEIEHCCYVEESRLCYIDCHQNTIINKYDSAQNLNSIKRSKERFLLILGMFILIPFFFFHFAFFFFPLTTCAGCVCVCVGRRKRVNVEKQIHFTSLLLNYSLILCFSILFSVSV